MVPPPFRSEPSTLPIPVPAYFERFYRSVLRPVTGMRVRSSLLLETYLVWASETRSPSVNYHELRRYMRAAGHLTLKSNGIQYVDVTFAHLVPDVPDGYRLTSYKHAVHPTSIDEVVASIDAASTILQNARNALARTTGGGAKSLERRGARPVLPVLCVGAIFSKLFC